MSLVVPQEVAELLRAGHTDTHIAAQRHMARRRVALMRAQLHIPPSQSTQAPRTIEVAFASRVRSLPGGHAGWIGPRNESGVPLLCWKDQRVSAYRAAFRIEYGREPVGVVRPVCDIPGCVAGRCLDDDAARQRTRGQLAVMLGRDQSRMNCRRGHAYAEHGVFRADGGRYCTECARNSQKGEAA